MSYYTSSGLPFESRQYRCEKHPLYEDPSQCSTCESNGRQCQLDRERGDAARAVIDQANRDYGASPYSRNLEQDIARSRSTNYGELRISARDPLYGAAGSASESYYRSYDSRAAYPTRSTSFRDPFEKNRYADRNQYGGNLRWDNSGSNPNTVRYADQLPPDSRDLDSWDPRSGETG
jgi:hypothetical protein